MDYRPYPYQAYCIDRVLKEPRLGLFLDMGLGKTVVMLTALEALIYDNFSVNKTLVVSTKSIAEATWDSERDKWAHLKNLTFSKVLGTAKQRRKALETKADIYLINFENLTWLIEETKDHWDFDTVIFDESSKMKDPSRKRYKAFKRVVDKVDRLYLLSGTPAPKDRSDLFGQLWLLDKGQRLGKNITAFRRRFMLNNPYAPFPDWKLREGAEKEIDEAIKDICIAMASEDYISLPDLIEDDVPIHLPAKALRSYKNFERDMVLELVDEGVITASSAAVLSNKLVQFASGAVYDENKEAVETHRAKLEAFLEVIEKLSGEPVMVFYNYRHELNRITKLLKENKLEYRELKDKKDIEDWNEGQIPILLAHPASAGHGLNLQKGGNHIIWFSLTWNLEHYEQANARLHRQGQGKPVIVHRLIVKGTRDEAVAKALTDKAVSQNELIESLKPLIERRSA